MEEHQFLHGAGDLHGGAQSGLGRLMWSKLTSHPHHTFTEAGFCEVVTFLKKKNLLLSLFLGKHPGIVSRTPSSQ